MPGQGARARLKPPSWTVDFPGMGKILPALAVPLAALAVCETASADSAPGPTPAPAPASTPLQQGALLKRIVFVWARARPSTRARKVERVWDRSPFSRRRTVVPVVSQAADPRGRRWLQVRLPTRPNGHTGWIPARSAKLVGLRWRIAVVRSKRRATLFRDGEPVRTFRVVVGARRSPTPRGHYFVVDRVLLHVSWAPRRWALATSAYSHVFRHFDGGNGQVALHARGFLRDRLGTAASHGCVRFADGDMAWLVRRVPNGTPIDVR